MRQYISDSYADKRGRLRIAGKDCRYLQQSLRLKRGDALDVRFPDGNLCRMEAVDFTKKYVDLKKIEEKREQTVARGVQADILEDSLGGGHCEFWLFQWMSRPQKMDIIIRQAVECGVSVIVPVKGDYSPSSSSSDRITRWQRIVKEARQQSGSPIASRIIEPCEIKEALSLWQESTASYTKEDVLSFVLHEDPSQKNSLYNHIKASPKLASLCCGCEGGFSKTEIQCLEASNFKRLHFKTNVLRAETAALYGMATLQTAILEIEKWK